MLAATETEIQRLRWKLRQLDKRLEQAMDLANQGRLSRDRLRTATREVTQEQLTVQEALAAAELRAGEQAEAGARRQARDRALNELLDGWNELSVEERQALLREVVDRIVINAEGPQVLLSP